MATFSEFREETLPKISNLSDIIQRLHHEIDDLKYELSSFRSKSPVGAKSPGLSVPLSAVARDMRRPSQSSAFPPMFPPSVEKIMNDIIKNPSDL